MKTNPDLYGLSRASFRQSRAEFNKLDVGEYSTLSLIRNGDAVIYYKGIMIANWNFEVSIKEPLRTYIELRSLLLPFFLFVTVLSIYHCTW